MKIAYDCISVWLRLHGGSSCEYQNVDDDKQSVAHLQNANIHCIRGNVERGLSRFPDLFSSQLILNVTARILDKIK